MTTKIILTRHGHVEGIETRRFRGRTDVPLTPLGVQQAKQTAIKIASAWRPSIVYTSPMGRCVSTGASIAEACNAPPKVLPDLNDLDYGSWNWKAQDEIAKEFPEAYAAWHNTPQLFRFPKGESLQDLVARAADVLRLVLDQHRDGTVVLVGHDSIGRALLTQVLDQPLSAYWRIVLDPCGLSEIGFNEGKPWVRRVNDTSHLAAIGMAQPQ